MLRRSKVLWNALARVRLALAALLIAAAGGGCDSGAGGGGGGPAPVQGYRVVAAYPHDPDAFTQGLLYRNGMLFESTGQRGQSSVRQVELETGVVLKIRRLPDRYFGEGIAHFEGRIYQLTWQAGKGFIYDAGSLDFAGEFSYDTEGWGFTDDGRQLIMSDGSATLRFLDPQSLRVVRAVEVLDDGRPVRRLNELEFVRGEVWANVWQTDRIARIDPESGRVVGWIDLAGLKRPEDGDVLNGIAYDRAGDRLFVTGKLWTRLYQIEVVER